MKTIRNVMATTRVDLHGDRFTLEALKSMRDHICSSYLPFTYNHDPRSPPLGRVFAAKIVLLTDGEHALEVEVELFEDGPLPTLGDRSMVVGALPDGLLLTIDRTFSAEEFDEPVESIATLFGRRPQLEIKKALEPIAVIGISASLFVVGKFAGSFASRLGTDAAAALSTKLKEIFTRTHKEETRLLRFEFEFEHRGKRCRADVILTLPVEAEIDGFLADGLRQLDMLLPHCLDQIDGLVRYVFTFSSGRVKLEFAVRRDAVPVFPSGQ